MRAAHRLIIVVTGLPIQMLIRACINASKVVCVCILFWSTWLQFSEHHQLPSGCTHHRPMYTNQHMSERMGVRKCETVSSGAHLCSDLVCTALYNLCWKIWQQCMSTYPISYSAVFYPGLYAETSYVQLSDDTG